MKLLISALMITGKSEERYDLACMAVDCFRDQTWDNKELIVINTSPSAPWFDGVENIREFKTDEKPLGELRNLSYEKAEGDYFIQWDDDDYHAPNRMEWQYKHHEEDHLSLLERQVRYDIIKHKGTVFSFNSGIEGTMFHGPTDFSYPDMDKGEDSEFCNQFRDDDKVNVQNNPASLYIRIFHGGNTWDRDHIMGGGELQSASEMDIEGANEKINKYK